MININQYGQPALPEIKMPSLSSLGGGLLGSFSAPGSSSKGSSQRDSVAVEGEDAAEAGLAQLPNFAAWDEGGTDGSGVDMRNGGAPITTQFLQSPKNVVKAVTSSATAASALGVSRSNLTRAQNNPFQKIDSLAAVMGGVSLEGFSQSGGGAMNGGSMGGLSLGGSSMSGGPLGGLPLGGRSMGGSLLGGLSLSGDSMSGRKSGSLSSTGLDASSRSGKLDRMPTMESGGGTSSIVRTSVSTTGESSLSVKKDEGGRQNLMAASARHSQAQETAGKNALENLTAGSSLGDLSKQHGMAQNDFLQNALGNMDAGQQNMDMAGMLGNQSQQAGDMSGLQAMIAEVMKAVQGVEKTKQAQAKATEAQGKATETQGKAIETSGQATEGTGVTTQANGVTTQATGVSLQAAASSMLAAAAAAAASVFGAPAGAALAAAGTAVMAQGTALNGMGVGLQGTGTALQAQGKAQQATGQATQAAGQQTQQVGRTQHDQAKAAEEKAKKEEQMRQQMAKMLAEQAQKLMQQATQSVNQAVNNFANALKSQELADKARQMRDETAEKAKDAFKAADDDKTQEKMAGANRKAVDDALKQVFGANSASKGDHQAAPAGSMTPLSAEANPAAAQEAGSSSKAGTGLDSMGSRKSGMNNDLGKKPAPLANQNGRQAAASNSRPGEARERGATGRDSERGNPLAAMQGMRNQSHGGSNQGGGEQQRQERGSLAQAPGSGQVAGRGGSDLPGGGLFSGLNSSMSSGSAGANGTPVGLFGAPPTGNAGSSSAKKSGVVAPMAGVRQGGLAGGQGRFGARSEGLFSPKGAGSDGLEQNSTSEFSSEELGKAREDSSVAGFSESEDSVTVNLNDLSGSASGSSGGSGSSAGSSEGSLTGVEAPDLDGLSGLDQLGSTSALSGTSSSKGKIPNGEGTASHKVSQQISRA